MAGRNKFYAVKFKSHKPRCCGNATFAASQQRLNRKAIYYVAEEMGFEPMRAFARALSKRVE